MPCCVAATVLICKLKISCSVLVLLTLKASYNGVNGPCIWMTDKVVTKCVGGTTAARIEAKATKSMSTRVRCVQVSTELRISEA